MLRKTSPLPLAVALAVGVAAAAVVVATDAAPNPRRLDAGRVCAELRSVGLGGGACGVATAPAAASPLASPPLVQSAAGGGSARRDACPTLCAAGVGRPLCRCDAGEEEDEEDVEEEKKVTTDLDSVCGFFCTTYSLRIAGCPACSAYRNVTIATVGLSAQSSIVRTEEEEVDWEAWCKEMCGSGDGGIACNCDILPMNAQISRR